MYVHLYKASSKNLDYPFSILALLNYSVITKMLY